MNPTDYDGDRGTQQEWRQCRWCKGYAEGPVDSHPRKHQESCPVDRAETAEATVRELEQARDTAFEAGWDARHRRSGETDIALWNPRIPQRVEDVTLWNADLVTGEGIRVGTSRDRAPTYTAILIQGNGIATTRPDDFAEVWVLCWPDAGIEIPWPEGLTVKAAIVAWADAQKEPV